MAVDFSKFQLVLEALVEARQEGERAAAADTTTAATDDQDCYPRGIAIDVPRGDPVWPSLRFLAKHLDWVRLASGPVRLFILPEKKVRFRLAEVAHLTASAAALTKRGIKCDAEVHYR